MSAPGAIDPVLAFLDFAERYRRSWRCWLIGGPAAADDLSLYASDQLTGIRIQADFQCEVVQRRWRHATGSVARRMFWYDAPEPHPPPEGTYADREEAFPLHETRVVGLCELCYGSGRRRCGSCGCTGRNTVDPPLGSIPCDGCGGKGDVPCRCGERVTRKDLVCYEEEVHTYRHEQEEFEVLSPRADAQGSLSVFRRAWRAAFQHVAGGAAAGTDLTSALESLPGLDELDEAIQSKVQEACRAIRQRAGELARSPSERIRYRILHQHVQASIVHASVAYLRQGFLLRLFRATGTGHRFEGAMRRLVPARNFWLVVVWMAFAGMMAKSDPVVGVPYALLLLLMAFLSLTHPTATPEALEWRAALHAVPAFLRYLRRSLKAAAASQVVVASPRPEASARLYALFAHLAAHAHLADPRQGGTVLDDVSLDLWRMVHAPSEAPAWSSTCRLALGAAVPGPARLRLVHMVGMPEDEPDDIRRAALGRAAQVWLVLPSWVPAREIDRWASRMLGASGEAAVTLVRDGDAPSLDDLPGVRARLAGRQHRVWHTDLEALSARYAAGQVPAAEAAAWVRWLIGGEEQPPAFEPAAAALPVEAPTRAAPDRLPGSALQPAVSGTMD